MKDKKEKERNNNFPEEFMITSRLLLLFSLALLFIIFTEQTNGFDKSVSSQNVSAHIRSVTRIAEKNCLVKSIII